ncbi:MAG TPA: DUF4293 family protein [Bacteroidales bacterium]|nr:DUF4293 family protein [Bacteroidales bacterium]
MIQRLQSLYLSLTILLPLLFLKGSFLTFIDKSGSAIKITFNGIVKVTDTQGFELVEKLLPLSTLIIVIPVLSLITLLLYKNRKIQKLFAVIIIVLASGLIVISAYYSFTICNNYSTAVILGVKMGIPILILILSILAYNGIRKDDRLVKSYDRLR